MRTDDTKAESEFVLAGNASMPLKMRGDRAMSQGDPLAFFKMQTAGESGHVVGCFV